MPLFIYIIHFVHMQEIVSMMHELVIVQQELYFLFFMLNPGDD